MSAPQLVAGNIVAGKYAVQGQLHSSGPGGTYHAITAPHREVVIKLFEAGPVPAETLAALRRLETMTNALPPNAVVHIMETGQDAQTGCPFSVTDLSQHPSLSQLVELCPVSPAEAATIMKNLGRVMQLAHAAKSVHLGLKPTNLFVGPAPGYEVRLADFGVTGLRTAPQAVQDKGAWRAWIAPEQMSGAGGPAADVFAAALVAFFAMTGRSYWRALTRSGFDFAAWQRELAAPRTLASVRASELSATLPASLDSVFTRALADAPRSRFASVAELAQALADALGQRAAPAPSDAKAPAVAPRAEARPGAAPGRLPKKTLIGIPSPVNLSPGGAPAPPLDITFDVEPFDLPTESDPPTEIMQMSQVPKVGDLAQPPPAKMHAPPRPAAGYRPAPAGSKPPANPSGPDVPPPPAAMMAIDPFAPPAPVAKRSAKSTQLGLGAGPSHIADLLAEAAAAAPEAAEAAAAPLVEEPERAIEPKFVVKFKQERPRWIAPAVIGGVVLLGVTVLVLVLLLARRAPVPPPRLAVSAPIAASAAPAASSAPAPVASEAPAEPPETAAPVARPKPAAAQPAPVVKKKKPCGKFLKRCD